MSLISLALLTVQLVCIAMGVPYDQPIARQPVVSQPLMKKPVVDHQNLGHSTIAAPVNRTISFATAHIYPTISSPKDASVYTTDDNPALDDGPKTPVNGPYGVPYLATSFSPSNTEVRNKRDSLIDYPTNDYRTTLEPTNPWSEEDTSNDYAHSYSRIAIMPPILFHHEPYEVQTITGNGHSVTRITEYVTITELSRIRAPDCPTFNGPHGPSMDLTTSFKWTTSSPFSRLEDCDIDRPPNCFDRQSCLVHPPFEVEGSAWTVHCRHRIELENTYAGETPEHIIASAPLLPCTRCHARLADSHKCEFVRQAC